MTPSRSNSSKTKRNNRYRRNLSSQKMIIHGSQARKKTQKRKKFNLSVKQGNKMWEHLINPSQWCLEKVDAFSNGNIFSILSGIMDERQKSLFLDTCFGHFLQANELVLNHQLIHQVLLREVKQSNEEEMWFDIGGSLVSFILENFCIINELRCNGDDERSKFDDPYCRIKNEYFCHLASIFPSDVCDVFLNKSSLSNRDVVSLGCLLLITSLVFTTAYKRYVEEWLMVIVDSEEMNTFAWGNELFRFTLSSLKLCLKNKSLN